jgi:succinoglycan biosynthesis transport protein ExoP
MDFLYLVRVLLKRKWIIIGSAIIAGIAAWYFTIDESKKYRSFTQIATGFSLSDEIRVTNDNFSFYETDTKFDNAIVNMTSPTIINLLAYQLILHDLEASHPFRSLTDEQKRTPLYRSINEAAAINQFKDNLETMTLLNSYVPDQKKLLEFLSLYKYDFKHIDKELKVTRLQRTDFLQIDFVSENPDLSAFVVNNLYQQFLRYYQTNRNRRSQESIDTLKNIMDKKKQELDIRNAALRGESPANIAVSNTHNLDQLSSLEQSLTDEKTHRTTLYYNLRKVNQRLADLGVATTSTTTTESATDPTANNNSEIVALHNQMNDAYQAYIRSGSTDKSLLTKYNNLRQQYVQKVTSATPATSGTATDPSKDPDNPVVRKRLLLDQKNDINLDIEASEATISDLQQRIDQLRNTTQAEASRGVTAETLMRDADQANKDYQDAKKHYDDAVDITTSSPTNFRQILIGTPAIEPETSKRLIIVAGAGFGASIIAALIITLIAALDSSVKTPVSFAKSVNLKLISMVNFMDLKHTTLANMVASIDQHYDPKEKQRHNVFRESLRKLRYEIEHSGKKTFLFTSTSKGQGKTTLIQALSYSMSLSKKKILILDTNFCNNDLTVALDAAPILEKIIPSERSEESLVQQVKDLSKDIGVESVFIIGAQGGDYTPSEILPRRHLLHHLQALTIEYDYIFLEGPPLNDFSDSKELVQYVDGVIAIFSANHTMKQIDKESIQFFNNLNGKFCGAILNMVNLEMVNIS